MRQRPFPATGVLLALPILFAPVGAAAQSPDLDWRQITTEHFVVTYPAGLADLGARAARSAEQVYDLLAERFVDPPEGRIQLLLSDHADYSNGSATAFPYNKVTILVRPPMDGGALSYFDDWIELVVTHELVHTFHLDMPGWMGRAIRAVFGRAPGGWPVFPSWHAPSWVLEGLATYYESELTDAGRVKGTWHDMVLRTAALEESLDRLDQVSGVSPVWPSGSRAYVYGAHYIDWLAEEHGEEALGDFARSVADLIVPYRFNAAAGDAFGTGISSSWEEWSRDAEERYGELAERLAEHAPITVGETVDDGGRVARQPIVSPDGATLAFARADGVDAAQIRLSAPGGSRPRQLARINGLSGTLSWGPRGDLFFTQLEVEGLYRVRSDLYRTSLDGGGKRITHGRRLTHSDVAPDGRVAVAVQEGGGTNGLVIVELATGDVTPLTERREDTHWAYPRWSPDGERIAVVRWTRPAMMDIVVLDAAGRLVARVTNDRAVDMTPFWTADGSTLLWSSDRTGIPNIFAARVDRLEDGGEPEVRQITNILGGATHPSVDRQGRWIHFASYHADGWHIERIPFDPESWFDPQPTLPAFLEQPLATAHGPTAPAATADYRVGPHEASGGMAYAAPQTVADAGAEGPREERYRALPTLRPYFWRPVSRAGESVRSTRDTTTSHTAIERYVGMATEGRDLVGRHQLSLVARMSLDGERLTGSFGYRYRGLGNPVLGLSFGQSHDAWPWTQILLPVADPVEYFLFDRERWATLSVTLMSNRFRRAAELTLSGSVVREDLSLGGVKGEAAPDRWPFSRPSEKSDFSQLRATASISRAQRRAYSISSEDGGWAWVSALRQGVISGLDDDKRDSLFFDRSYSEITGELALFKSLRLGWRGFSNHVLGVRLSGGVASGPGADRYHFDVGDADGTPESLTGYGLFGGSPALLPLRGYRAGARWGTIAWTASAEYRFPILVADRGLGLFPLFLDRVYGSVFWDVGNAWGPVQPDDEDLDDLTRFYYHNPRMEELMSAGAELSVILSAFYQPGLTLRFGVGYPLVENSDLDPVFYVRIGNSF